MNCPMCGSPLGDGDRMCSACGTKRSEMGPAFNNAGGAANSYGSTNNYGSTGGYGNYGNANNYGNTNNYGNYGNTNNYGNNFGRQNSFGGGAGTREAQRAHRVASTLSTRTMIRLIALLVVIVVAIFGKINSRPVTKDFGDFTATVPSSLKEDNDDLFNDNDGVDSGCYRCSDYYFAFIKYDMSEALEESTGDSLEKLFVSTMDSSLSTGLDSYHKDLLMDNMLRFDFRDEGEKYHAIIKGKCHGKALYMLVVYCTDKNANSRRTKMARMLDTIKFK